MDQGARLKGTLGGGTGARPERHIVVRSTTAARLGLHRDLVLRQLDLARHQRRTGDGALFPPGGVSMIYSNWVNT